MKRVVLIISIISMAFVLVACSSSGLSDDEQYALDCAKQIPYVTEEELSDNLGEIYLVKESDQSIKYAVIKYYVDYYGTLAQGEAVFKDGNYYIDANDTFDTTDLSSANGDKIIAQRDVRLVDMGQLPTGAEWEVVQIDPEVIKQALLEE